MKKTFAGLGVLALVALGATGASFPAIADEPVAEIVAASDAIVASPDAVLTQAEPVITVIPAEVPAEPVAVVVEPVSDPVSEPVVVVSEPVAVSVPVVVAPVAPVVSEPVVAAVEPVVDPVAKLYARTLGEGRLQFGQSYIQSQDANAPRTEGFVYTPSLVDPTKVHVSVIPFDQVPKTPKPIATPTQPASEPTPVPAP